MTIDVKKLPDDIALLRQMFIDLLRAYQEREQEVGDLKHQLSQFRRRIFGRSSEKLDPAQLRLAFEELQQQVSGEAPVPPPPRPDKPKKAKSDEPKPRGRQPLPPHLPRETVPVEPPAEALHCGTCNSTNFEKIGEEVTEVLEYRPASFFVKKYVRPKYACADCHDHVVIGDLPQQPIEKGIPGPGLLAHVITSKYADHLPLYRIQDIFARENVEVKRRTMCGWLAHVAALLLPIYAAMVEGVKQSKVIHADDTPVRVLDPGNKKTKQGRVWVYIGDREHPHVVYDYQTSRKRDGPMHFLRDFKGYLQGDAWKGFNAICGPNKAQKCACWAHVRRRFVEAEETEKTRALTALQFVRALYDVEDDAKEAADDARRDLRARESKGVLGSLIKWLELERGNVLPKSPMGQAIQYALGQWPDLKRYLDDGAIDIDNNEAEREMRAIAVGRKNWMFYGSDEGGRTAAVLSSLVASCKRNDVDPFAYLRDVLDRISLHHRVEDLTPVGWKRCFGTVSTASPVGDGATAQAQGSDGSAG